MVEITKQRLIFVDINKFADEIFQFLRRAMMVKFELFNRFNGAREFADKFLS